MHRNLLLALSAVLAACSEARPSLGSGDADATDASSNPIAVLDAGTLPTFDGGKDCETFVSDALIEHSCFHAIIGPFRDRAADVDANGVTEVNRAHTAFRIALPKVGTGYAGMLRYQARWSGAYAFFTSPQIEVAFPGSTSASIPFAEHETELCPELPWVRAFLLGKGEHTVMLRSAVPEVVLVVEYMDEGTVDDGYRFECPEQVRPSIDAGFEEDSDAGPTHIADAQISDGAGPELDAGPDTSDAGPEAGTECKLDPVLEHSCLHVTNGPYATVSAVSSGVAPNVNAVHTAFTINLPSMGGASEVTYRPNGGGEYVFYTSEDVLLTLLDPSNAEVAVAYREEVVDCSGFKAARVYVLESAMKYRVVLGASTLISVTLLIENVEALAPGGWSQRFEACE